jgi:UDP-3-O-acyl-N-acetylglucosamine deacetylase
MVLSHAYIGSQRIVCTLSPQFYTKEIAPARTFVFTNEDDPRLKNLPPYGIGITKNGIRAVTPLRFPDEPVRHKLLDLLGDLYVLKRNLYGRITGRNTSHRINLEFVRRLIVAEGRGRE